MLAQPADRVHFNESADRITDAIQLYKTGKVKQLLISGGSGSLLHPELIESTRIKDYLLAIGIPETDIIIDAESDNTYQNAVNSIEMIHARNPDSTVLLITSGTHMRRAAGCFKKAGMNVERFSTDIHSIPFEFGFGLFIPSAGTMITWGGLIKEWVGYLVYWIVGYL